MRESHQNKVFMHWRPVWYLAEQLVTFCLMMAHRWMSRPATFGKFFVLPMKRRQSSKIGIQCLKSSQFNLKSYISKEPILDHEHSAATSEKSEVITLPVLMKDEKKYGDCVDVLEQLEEWTHEIYYASGLNKKPLPSDQINLEVTSHLSHQALIH